MKTTFNKIGALLLALVLTLSLAACGTQAADGNSEESSSATVQETTSATNAVQETAETQEILDVQESPAFHIETRTVRLNNGIEMPILGLGTYALSPEEAENSVYHALSVGYRLIDTANAYMNERAVGRGIKRAIDEGIVTREEIFLTTKLWVSEYETVETSIDETLARLDLDYIDLLLLHQPYGNYTKAYQDMEQAVEDGKVRAIGLSNFYGDRFDEVISGASIPPAVLQVETNPLNQQRDTKEIIAEYGTQIEAWSPLGGRGHTDDLFNNETLAQIAEAHDKSVVQIILRWHMQTGNIAIPGSRNPDHIQENIEIFDFELTDEEMAEIDALDTGTGVYDFSPEAVSGNDSSFTSAERPDFDAQE